LPTLDRIFKTTYFKLIMMKKIAAVLFSMLTTSCLLVVFAVAIAYATFVENDYGTQTAQILIYSARWFEILLILTGFNLIGGLFYYKAFKLKRWSMVLFHVAFIIILIGAGITRFFSYEGMMHIREGESSNQLLTTQTYIQVEASDDSGSQANGDWAVSLSPYTYANFNESLEVGGKDVNLEILDYVPNGIQTVVADETGTPTIELLVLDGGERKNIALSLDESIHFRDFSLSFEGADNPNTVLIKRAGPGLEIISPDTLHVIKMTGEQIEPYLPGVAYPLTTQNMFRSGEDMFVLRGYKALGRKALIAGDEGNSGLPDAVLMNVTVGDESRQVAVYGQNGQVSRPIAQSLNGVEFQIQYGAKMIHLPFSIQLNQFQLERYPGSMSPSSFASEVTLIDSEAKIEKPYRIYMNNILDYGGYRFFQSSYDTDEKGTVLSVSFDRLGTMVTYIGYFLMSFGMLFSFFNKKSRFQFLLRSASRVKELKRKNLAVLALIFALSPAVSSAQASKIEIDKAHLKSINELLVQDRKGRVEPVNTLASELLRKLTRKNSYEGLSATEVFMGMTVMPDAWKNEPMIKISNSELASKLGIKGNFASFNQLVDMQQGIYRLRSFVDEAYQKKPNNRNKFDKEVINVDERVNICFQVYNGGFLNVFPDKEDTNQTWRTEADYFSGARANPVPEDLLLTNYKMSLQKAMLAGDYTKADQNLDKLIRFQHEHGSELILSTAKVRMEILYNNLNIFGWLSKLCALLGIALLVVHLLHVFNYKLNVRSVLLIGNWITVLLFLVYSAGLAIRWYISDHAPWSNSYETLLYVGWATLLSGFVFIKKSQITLSVTLILSSLILMVAGMSWLNPEITNLVPVLKSYWLIVHVAVITASYGFLGIGALLGMLNLVIMILRTKGNIKTISYTIAELAIVIELALIVGLVLLTIGAFIGGVWANESWGRYWGWDPKETWALVTILVYSFIIHLRKVPGMDNHFVLSLLALVGFSSVLMTFFGVNYYLSGMHSYGQGDPPPVPSGVYFSIVAIIFLGIFAGLSERKFANKAVALDVENS